MDLISEEHFKINLSKLRLPELITINADKSFHDVITLMREKDIGSVIIGNQSNIEGIFTERDIITKLDLILEDRNRPIKDIMTPDPISLTCETELVEAMTLMSSKEFRHVPIKAEDGTLYMLSIQDIVKYIVALCGSKLVNVKPITDWDRSCINLDETNILHVTHEMGKCLSTQFLDVPLRRIYTSRVSIVDDELSIIEGLRILAEKNHSVALLMQYQTELVGIVTERDILLKAFSKDLDLNMPIKSICTLKPHTLSRDHTFANAIKNMFSHNYRNVPIVNQEGFPIGNISLLELLIFFCSELGFRRIAALN